MENYPSNSHKSRERESSPSETEQKLKKVVTGEVTFAKKNFVRRILGKLSNGDMENVGSYILSTVVFPSIKRIIGDSVNIALGLDSAPRRNGGSLNERSSIYQGKFSTDDSRDRYNIRDLYEVDEIILTRYGDCEAVLDEMTSAIEEYGMVSVADLYDFLGRSARHTDFRYGWKNLKTARIVPVRTGYKLVLPRVTAL